MKVTRVCGGILLLANCVCAQGTFSAITGYGTTAINGYAAFAVGFTSDTVGWSFIPSQNLEVTALGCAPGADPMTTEIEFGLWTGEGTLLASASVDLASGSSFTSINPVILQAGNTYVVGGWGGIGTLGYTVPLEPITSPQIEPVDVAESEQTTFAFPTPYAPVSTGQETTLLIANFQFAMEMYPLILNNSTNFGVRPSGFSFTVFWASNATVVVEASTNLTAPDWQPLQTNTIVATNGTFDFSDPEWTNYPGRFYRVVAQ